MWFVRFRYSGRLVDKPTTHTVTGASSGLCRAVVEYVLEKGDRVVATLRKPSALADLVIKCPEDQLLVSKLDVIAPADITAAFSAALAKFGRVDIVVVILIQSSSVFSECPCIIFYSLLLTANGC